MNLITRLALKNRLLHVLLLGIALCFLAVAAAFSIQQKNIYHEELHRDLTGLAQLINANWGGALAYGADWVSLELFEQTMKSEPAVAQAVLFSASGEVLAEYRAAGSGHASLPPFHRDARSGEGHTHEAGHEVYHPFRVSADQPLSGVLYMRGSLAHIDEEMQRFYLLQFVCLVVVLLLTYFAARQLQTVISEAYREQQQQLETKVAERTAELSQARDKLHLEVEERKQAHALLQEEKQEHLELIAKLEEAQHQLLQAEKMASIGQLAAGVAHEINNPVGFIGSNMNTLSNYVEDLLRLLEVYGQSDALLEAQGEAGRRVQEVKGQVDFDYLVSDVRELVQESSEGIERVRKIVQDLKDFSRSEGREYQWANLHQGLDSTLNMATNEIKYKAEVVKEYAELPEVYCCQSQINQVVLNLLVNAAQAMNEMGVIHLRTGQEDERVWIEVEDSGKGIEAENLKRIFEPFYTTKPVGQGTGLGLSLSYGIVRDHGGTIEVDSEVGRGTRFRVWLPLRCNEPDKAEQVAVAAG